MLKNKKLVQLKINFLRNDQAKIANMAISWITNLGLPIMVLVAAIVMVSAIYKLMLDQNLANIQQEISQAASTTKQYTGLQNELEAITSKYKDIELAEDEKIALLLPKLTFVLPPQITLNELSISKDSVRFSGNALDKQAISYLVNNIQNIKNEELLGGEKLEFNDIRVEEIATTSITSSGFSFAVRFGYKFSKLDK